MANTNTLTHTELGISERHQHRLRLCFCVERNAKTAVSIPWHRQIEKYRLKLTQTPSIPTPAKIERSRATTTTTKRTENTAYLWKFNFPCFISDFFLCPPNLSISASFSLFYFIFSTLYNFMFVWKVLFAREQVFFSFSFCRSVEWEWKQKKNDQRLKMLSSDRRRKAKGKTKKKLKIRCRCVLHCSDLVTWCWRAKRVVTFTWGEATKV